MQDKIRIRRMMSKDMRNSQVMIKQGNNLVQSRRGNKDCLKFCKLYSVDKMACLLQPECNFLHGFFRCKLPVEVVDVEGKGHVDARDPFIQMRQDHPGNQMHTMDH